MIKAIKRNWFEIILVTFILLGVLISLIDLLHNKSLWLDEACLALNIVSRSYLELLSPLADNQSAPIGFLFTEKLLTNIFGPHDWALKIFPFFSFIVSIILFFSLNNRLFKSVKIALLSCALFSLNFTLISYSTEVKQYSIDVLVAILIVLSSLKFNANKNNLSIFLHTCIGAIAIWYSNVAIIILITAAIYNIYYSLFNNDKKELSVFIPISIWMASFITYYMLFISNHPHTDNMVNYWNTHFLPNNIFSQEFYTFLYDKVRMIFANLLHTNDLWVVALFFYSIGIFLLIKAKKNNYLHLLCLPIIIHLGLSFLHLYPFYDRFLLYQIPFVIIPISYGFILISSYFKNYHISKIMTICLLLTYTFGPSALIQSSSSSEEEIKKSLSFLNTHISSEDHIYVYYSSAPAFKFYKNNYPNITKKNEIYFGEFNRGNPKNYITEIESISGDIWLIFSHMYTQWHSKQAAENKDPDHLRVHETEEQFIIKNLMNHNYTVLFEAKFKDSSCYKIRKSN